jgi:hypothetical protein
MGFEPTSFCTAEQNMQGRFPSEYACERGFSPPGLTNASRQSAGHFLQGLSEDEPRGSLDQGELRQGLREVSEVPAGLGVELLRI